MHAKVVPAQVVKWEHKREAVMFAAKGWEKGDERTSKRRMTRWHQAGAWNVDCGIGKCRTETRRMRVSRILPTTATTCANFSKTPTGEECLMMNQSHERTNDSLHCKAACS